MNASRATSLFVLAALAIACSAKDSSSAPDADGGNASLSLRGTTYEVSDVSIMIEPGEEAWFRIDGEHKGHTGEDCVPGLASGIGFYGDLPASVKEPQDLAGQRLRVDFSGDGDDANFCFAGMGGLAGAEDAWVTIESVSGDRVRFSMTGSFKVYDENGEGPVVSATASGEAMLRKEEA